MFEEKKISAMILPPIRKCEMRAEQYNNRHKYRDAFCHSRSATAEMSRSQLKRGTLGGNKGRNRSGRVRGGGEREAGEMEGRRRMGL